MAKIPDVYLKYTHGIIDVRATYNKKGTIAKLARMLHSRFQKRWLFNLGYGIIDAPQEPQPIGTVVGNSDDGTVIIEVK